MTALKPAAPESICALLTRAMSDSDERRQMHRLYCVLLASRGRTCDEIAQWFNISARSVQRWARAYADLGVKGLLDHHVGGRPSLLSPDLMDRLDEEISLSPSKLGYTQSRWTGDLVVRHVAEHFGVTLSVRQGQRLLTANRRRMVSSQASELQAGRPLAGATAESSYRREDRHHRQPD